MIRENGPLSGYITVMFEVQFKVQVSVAVKPCCLFYINSAEADFKVLPLDSG